MVGDDGLPVEWIEEYLDGLRLRVYGTSPNTVKAYARGLGLYQSFLDEFGCCWRTADLETFDEFVAWLRAEHPGQQDDTYAARVDAVVSNAAAEKDSSATHSSRQLATYQSVSPIFGNAPR